MALHQFDLERASYRFSPGRAHTLVEAKAANIRTAFLCHSHLDEELAKGLVTVLAEQGISLYVDWADQSMPATPNRTTAAKIQDRIRTCDLFLLLATKNSMASRWCPWEIGYADGIKLDRNILIIPTVDASGIYHGNEYLQLYRKIDGASLNALQVFDPASSIGTSIRYL